MFFVESLGETEESFHDVRETIKGRGSGSEALNIVFGREREIFDFFHVSFEIGFIVPVEANALRPYHFQRSDRLGKTERTDDR